MNEFEKKLPGLPFGISGSTLKIIAVITMMIDHVAASVLIHGVTDYSGFCEAMQMNAAWLYNLLPFLHRLSSLCTAYMVCRAIGRIAFPIYCYLLVEGYIYTRDVKKYMLRLGIFAIISEIPFDMAFSGTLFDWGSQNVFFTMFFGLLMITVLDLPAIAHKKLLMIPIALCFFFVPQVLGVDYGGTGVLIIWIIYQARGGVRRSEGNRKIAALVTGVCFVWEIYAVIAALFLYLYNGKRGLRIKYLFYAIYPVHLFLLGLATRSLGFWT